jgi:hypothetical protein
VVSEGDGEEGVRVRGCSSCLHGSESYPGASERWLAWISVLDFLEELELLPSSGETRTREELGPVPHALH